MTRPTTTAISLFFIVSNVDRIIAFYRERLGFETTFQEPDRNAFSPWSAAMKRNSSLSNGRGTDKSVVLLAKIEEIGISQVHAMAVRGKLRHRHYLLWVRKGKRTKQHCVHYREDGR